MAENNTEHKTIRETITMLQHSDHGNSENVKVVSKLKKKSYKTVYNVVRGLKETDLTSGRSRSARPNTPRSTSNGSVRKKVERNFMHAVGKLAKEEKLDVRTRLDLC